MATKVDVISRCVERLLPLIGSKERPTLRGQVLAAQKWCGDATTDHLNEGDVSIVVLPFLVASTEPRDEAIATSGLDALDKLMGHAVVFGHMPAPAALISAISGLLPPAGGNASVASTASPAPSGPASPSNDDAATQAGASTIATAGSSLASNWLPPTPRASDVPTLLDIVVEVVATRATSLSDDVLINVIRTLLTAVAACDARGQCLSRAVEALLVILLRMRAPSKHVQQTGKASLSQIAGIVQRRTELCGADSGPDDGAEPEAWIDCAALLGRFTQLIEGPDLARMTLGLTLVHNSVMTLDPAAVARSPTMTDLLRRQLTTRLLPLLGNPSAHISKPAMYLLQHLLETFRRILRRELPPILNFIYVIAERSSHYGLRSLAYGAVLGFAKNAELLFDMYRNYDCEVGQFDVFEQFCEKAQLLAGTPPNSANLDFDREDALKLTGLAAVNAIAQSIRRFREARFGVDGSETAGSDHSDLTYSEIVRQLESKRRYTAVLRRFAEKPKDGLEAALSEGMLASKSPPDVARFLLTKGIDKKMVGDYLATNSPEVNETVVQFIKLCDFTGLTIDEALRLMLGNFKIGGEAQTIDRTMQVFAKQYCEQNPGSFAEQDTVYVLAFSTMMLNTDQHSPNVREKMTKDQFIATNRGIDNGNDLPRDLLEGIYRRIKENEIRLNDDTVTLEDEVVVKAVAPPTAGKKDGVVAWNPEPCAQKTMERVSVLSSYEPLRPCHDPQLAVLLFNSAWPQAHLALTQQLDDTHEGKVLGKVFEGIDRYISVACQLGNAACRRTFLVALRAASRLGNASAMHFETLHFRQVKCVDAMIHVAARDGNDLDDSWGEVLLCVSKATAIANRLAAMSQTPNRKLSKHDATTHESLVRVLKVDTIDAMFATAKKLTDTALMALVEGLLQTSLMEFKEAPPRTSAFIQFVEVLGGALNRQETVVAALWTTLSSTVADVSARLPKVADVVFRVLDKFYAGLQKEHESASANTSVAMSSSQTPAPVTTALNNNGRHGDPNAATLDGPSPTSQQLDKLPNPPHAAASFYWDHRQDEALDVLWRAAWQSRISSVRTCILSNLIAIIQRGAVNINVAWASILRIHGLLARDPDNAVSTRAYFTLASALGHAPGFDMEAFTVAISAATAFAACGNPDVEADAIELLEALAAIARYGAPTADDGTALKNLQAGEFKAFVVAIGVAKEVVPIQCDVPDIWNTIIGSVASLVSSPSASVRERCVETLFRILSGYPEVWAHAQDSWTPALAGAVAPVLAQLFFQLEEAPQVDEQHAGIIRRALAFLSSLFLDQHETLESLRGYFFDAVAKCLAHPARQIADIGMGHLREWVSASAGVSTTFSTSEWMHIGELAARSIRGPCNSVAPAVVAQALSMLEAVALAASSRSPLLEAFEAELLPALVGVFQFCREARVTYETATYTALLEFENRTALTALELIQLQPTAQRVAHTNEWAQVIMHEYSTAADRSTTGATRTEKANSAQCAKVLTGAVVHLLTAQLEAEDDELPGFVDPLSAELADLIRSCEARIAGPLSLIFRRRMQLLAAAPVPSGGQ
jgi:hypothetical protein